MAFLVTLTKEQSNSGGDFWSAWWGFKGCLEGFQTEAEDEYFQRHQSNYKLSECPHFDTSHKILSTNELLYQHINSASQGTIYDIFISKIYKINHISDDLHVLTY